MTVWRAEHTWLRECPMVFGRCTIQDASVACRRVIQDNSDRVPHRHKDGRIILSCVNPPVRKYSHIIHIPGFGVVETAKAILESLEMRSFKIVDVTRYVNKDTKHSDHMFELHIAVQVPVEPHRATGVVRGINVGGKHLAVTVDTNAVHNTRHRNILRDIDALKHLHDRKKKGGRKWCIIHDQM
ncbi:MAG: hypothetical protein F4W68_02225 [Cenarchaeum sp. SB0661_bin_35]|nr:hypothetical protein [Cenarchaeum sp. SB0661_bin_35]MYI51349.1 hypothetical protein [Cenarchaeum sp. SB0673_bin_9]